MVVLTLTVLAILAGSMAEIVPPALFMAAAEASDSVPPLVASIRPLLVIAPPSPPIVRVLFVALALIVPLLFRERFS